VHEFRIESDHASSKQAAGDGVTAEDVRVLIVSGHALNRYGLSVALNSQPGVNVVAEADNPDEAIKLAGELQPDVVVLDTVHAGRRAAKIIRMLLSRPAAEAPAILILAHKICDCSFVMGHRAWALASGLKELGYSHGKSYYDELVDSAVTFVSVCVLALVFWLVVVTFSLPFLGFKIAIRR